MTKPKAIVLCKDYNGVKNVLFMMETEDFRFNDGNYSLLTGGTYDRKKGVFHGENGKDYLVFVDWSVREVKS